MTPEKIVERFCDRLPLSLNRNSFRLPDDGVEIEVLLEKTKSPSVAGLRSASVGVPSGNATSAPPLTL